MSPMAMMAPSDGDGDWCHALGDFNFNLLLCSSSSSSPHAMASSSREQECLPIAAAPPAPGAGGTQVVVDDDAAFAAPDCLSSALMNLQREDESFCMPMYSAPPLPAVVSDQLDQLPPLPADLDEALLLPFSDIDLAAFDNNAAVDEQKPPPLDQMIMIPPPAVHHHHPAAAAGTPIHGTTVVGQNAGVVVHGAHQIKNAMDIEDDKACFRRGEASGVEMAVVAAALVPPPPPQPLPLPPPLSRPPRARRSGGDRPSASAPAGKTRLDHIGFDDLRKYFYMPITRAAREMNVGLTVLKKRCRELGVARWPHRKMKSLKSLMANVQEMGNGMSPAAMQQELAALETYCALMEEHPWIELTDRTKKLRQACFKESYKRRRAAAVSAMEMDHIYSFGYHHQLPPPASNPDDHHVHQQSSRIFGY